MTEDQTISTDVTEKVHIDKGDKDKGDGEKGAPLSMIELVELVLVSSVLSFTFFALVIITIIMALDTVCDLCLEGYNFSLCHRLYLYAWNAISLCRVVISHPYLVVH